MGNIDFKLLKSKTDKKSFEKIKDNYAEVFKKGEVISDNRLFSMNFGKTKLWLKEGSSSAEVMTLFEMFKDKNHHKIKQFQGKQDNVILDIGANEGYYTLKMKDNNPSLQIFAFEPIPETFKILKKNILANNLKNVHLVNYAVGKENKKIEFEYVPEATAISSIKIDLKSRQWLDKKRIRKIKVNCVNLPWIFDKYKLSHVDIMKIDTEGAEFDILRGGKEVLDKINRIVIEFHSEKLKKDCIEFLTKRGFVLIKEENRDCGDIYFVRK
jgi:FkbM family methyltransferase